MEHGKRLIIHALAAAKAILKDHIGVFFDHLGAPRGEGGIGVFQCCTGHFCMIIASDTGVRASIKFDVVTCVNNLNYDTLEQFKEYLITLGLKSWRLFTVFPAGRAAADPQLQLDREKFRGLMEFIKKTRKEGRIRASYGCEGFLGEYEGEVRDHLFSCQAGLSIASVRIDGSISACGSIRADYSQGNIYTDDFLDVWENRFHPYRNRSWMKSGKCSTCKWFRYCQGNGMHLRGSDGELLLCHLEKL